HDRIAKRCARPDATRRPLPVEPTAVAALQRARRFRLHVPQGGGGGALDTSRVSARSRHRWRVESAPRWESRHELALLLANVGAAGLYAGAVRHAPDQGTTHNNPRLGSAQEYRQTNGAASFVSAAATIGSQSVHEVSARGTGDARPPVNRTFTASGHDLAAVRRPRNRFASSTSIGGNS